MESAVKTILLVEDYKDTSELLTSFLEGLGYRVSQAADGMSALRAALRESPDLILMDLDLPVLDGMTAADLLRRHDRLRDTPVVAITAYHAAYTRAEAMSRRCDEYLTKPIDLAKLEGALRRLLARR